MEEKGARTRVIIVLLLLILLTSPVYATQYYFSETSGDDSRTPSQATNQDTPWKTFNPYYLNNITLSPGDGLLFEKGGVYRCQINLSQVGSILSSPITITSYGSASNPPIISGAQVVTSWSSSSTNNAYQAQLSASTPNITNLFDNNVVQILARYPNRINSITAFARCNSVTSGNGIQTCTDPSSAVTTSLVGATVRFRSSPYTYAKALVTAYNNKQITTSTNDIYGGFIAGAGYYVENTLSLLDSPGEWYYNPSNHILYYYPPSGDPNTHVIEATVYKHGVLISNSQNIVIDGISFLNQGDTAVVCTECSNITVSNSVFRNQQTAAVDMTSTAGGSILNNDMSNIDNTGVVIAGGSDNTISYNNITEIGTRDPAQGPGGLLNAIGITLDTFTQTNTIQNNIISRTGYIGMRFDGAGNLVKQNYVTHTMLTLSDGGGIYAYSERSHGSTVINNIVSHSYGNVDTLVPASSDIRPQGFGIYLDDYTYGTTVVNNTLINTYSAGLYIHDSNHNYIQGNTLFNSSVRQLFAFDQFGYLTTNNNTLTGNLFYTIGVQLSISKATVFNTTELMLDVTNNQFCSPFFDSGFTIEFIPGQLTLPQFLNAIRPRDNYGNTQCQFINSSSLTLFSTTGPELLQSSSQSSSVLNWGFYPNINLSLTVVNLTSPFLCNNCMELIYAPACCYPRSASVLMNTGIVSSLVKGKWYVISGVFGSTMDITASIIPRDRSNYGDVGINLPVSIAANQLKTFEITFQSQVSNDNLRFDVVIPLNSTGAATGSNLYVQQLSLQEAMIHYQPQIFLNPSDDALDVSLRTEEGVWIDIDGNVVCDQRLRLEPWSSKVLVSYNGSQLDSSTCVSYASSSQGCASGLIPSWVSLFTDILKGLSK